MNCIAKRQKTGCSKPDQGIGNQTTDAGSSLVDVGCYSPQTGLVYLQVGDLSFDCNCVLHMVNLRYSAVSITAFVLLIMGIHVMPIDIAN